MTETGRSETEDADPKAEESAAGYCIGIGASAGGLEALETFFSNMPADSGAAFVVVQHLSPDYKSLMVELLSRHTRMPVRRAAEGMPVMPDTVYLIPPAKNLRISENRLWLSGQDHSQGLNLPIDLFFRSLARDRGNRSVAVILSGTGSDGMRGIRSVKESGGVVFVQNPDTAKFDGMPRSALSTGLADFVLAPEEMPAQLVAWLNHPYVASPETEKPRLESEEGLPRIFVLLRERTGVDFSQYKPATVLRRVERRMSVNQIMTLPEYVVFVENSSREAETLGRELLIGVTSFFRDPESFEILREKVLPALFRKSAGQEMRVWCAGCSTGEEAYSLAILFSEYMAETGRRERVRIFATDVDRDAIMRAGNGLYPESIAADLTPERLSRFFHRHGEQYRVNHQLREMVVFAQHNIIKAPPFPKIELISCRNLLIYLKPAMQQKVFSLFDFSLTRGGFLFLGSSESAGEMGRAFELIHAKWKIYRGRGGRRKPVEDSELLSSLSVDTRPWERGTRHGQGIVPGLREERLFERFLEVLSGLYVPLALVVSENMEVARILGEADRFFRLPAGKMRNDITRMAARDLAAPITTGIQKVFKEKKPVVYKSMRLQRDKPVTINLRIHPLPHRAGQEDFVVVFLEELREGEDESGTAPALEWNPDDETRRQVHDLEQELQFTRENLQATIEELETSNEELQATNEELLAANEELQSTNEELQSVNEELFTVNAEYQTKILELTELNNDMDNLLRSTEIGTLFLDDQLEIRKFTPRVQDILQVRDQDIGRPLAHLNLDAAAPELLQQATAVRDRAIRIEREMQSPDGQWYLMRVLPYRVSETVISGVVVTFIDINRLKNMQDTLQQHEALLNETGSLARVGGWQVFLNTGELYWSEEVFRIHEVPADFIPSISRALDFLTPVAREHFQEGIRLAEEEGLPLDMELELTTAAGNRRVVHAIGQIRRRDSEAPVLTGALQDITEKRAEDARLLKVREQLAGVLHSTLHSIMLFSPVRDDAGRIIDFEWVLANAAAAAVVGHAPEELKGRRLLDVTPGNRDTGLFDRYAAVVENSVKLDIEQYYDHDGIRTWFHIVAEKVGDGFAVAFEDITGRKEREQELETFADLTALNPHPVLRAGRDGVLRYANPAAAPLLRNDAFGIGEALPEVLLTPARAALSSGEETQGEAEYNGWRLCYRCAPARDREEVFLFIGMDPVSEDR
jgi:two-component system, chemotaxis family, CheB/CheR fusion protein